MSDPYRENANQNTTAGKTTLQFKDKEEQEFWDKTFAIAFGYGSTSRCAAETLADDALLSRRARSRDLP